MSLNSHAEVYDTPEVLTLEGYPSVGTLAKWRLLGKGPPFVKFGKLVRYPRSKRREWEDRQLRRSTSDTGKAA